MSLASFVNEYANTNRSGVGKVFQIISKLFNCLALERPLLNLSANERFADWITNY